MSSLIFDLRETVTEVLSIDRPVHAIFSTHSNKTRQGAKYTANGWVKHSKTTIRIDRVKHDLYEYEYNSEENATTIQKLKHGDQLWVREQGGDKKFVYGGRIIGTSPVEVPDGCIPVYRFVVLVPKEEEKRTVYRNIETSIYTHWSVLKEVYNIKRDGQPRGIVKLKW